MKSIMSLAIILTFLMSCSKPEALVHPAVGDCYRSKNAEMQSLRISVRLTGKSFTGEPLVYLVAIEDKQVTGEKLFFAKFLDEDAILVDAKECEIVIGAPANE